MIASCLVLGHAGVVFAFDMKAGEYGPPVLGFLLALSLTLIMCRLARMVERTKTVASGLALLGMASLVVMFLHQFVHLNLRRLEGEVAVVLLLSVVIPVAAYIVAVRVPMLAVLYLGRKPKPKEPTLLVEQ